MKRCKQIEEKLNVLIFLMKTNQMNQMNQMKRLKQNNQYQQSQIQRINMTILFIALKHMC